VLFVVISNLTTPKISAFSMTLLIFVEIKLERLSLRIAAGREDIRR